MGCSVSVRRKGPLYPLSAFTIPRRPDADAAIVLRVVLAEDDA